MKEENMTTPTEIAKTEEAFSLPDNERASLKEKVSRWKNKGEIKTEIKEDGQRHSTIPLDFNKWAYSMATAFGTLDSELITMQLNYLSNIVSVGKDDKQSNNILAMLYNLHPENALEGLLAAQITATNHVAMRMLSQSLERQDCESAQHYTNRAHKAQNLLLRQIQQLHAMQNGGQTTQKVIVEKVEVQSGGQAIVGAVAQGGGGKQQKTEA